MRFAASGWFAISLAAYISIAGIARGQAITFNDLQGLTVDATAVYEQTFRRLDNDRVLTNISSQDTKLRIGAGETLTHRHTTTVTAPDGRHIGSDTREGSFTLNVPRNNPLGSLMWRFEDGKLVFLQTFKSGGRRYIISFSRTAGGFDCQFDAPFAREEGAGNIRTTATVGGFEMEWLNVKQTSSSCRAEKSKGD